MHNFDEKKYMAALSNLRSDVVETKIESFAYNKSAGEEIFLGKNMFHSGSVGQLYFTLKHSIQAEVRDGKESRTHTTEVGLAADRQIFSSCTCEKHEKEGICAHAFAVLYASAKNYYLHHLLRQRPFRSQTKEFLAEDIPEDTLKNSLPKKIQTTVNQILASGTIKITKASKGKYQFIVKHEKEYNVILEKNLYSTILHAFCNCNDTRSLLCPHKATALIQLAERYGKYAFENSYDWDAEKKELLAPLGLSPQNYPADKLQFYFTNGRLALRVLDTQLKQVGKFTHFQGLAPSIPDNEKLAEKAGIPKDKPIIPAFIIRHSAIAYKQHITFIHAFAGTLKSKKNEHKKNLKPLELAHLTKISREERELVLQLKAYEYTAEKKFENAIPALPGHKALKFKNNPGEASRLLVSGMHNFAEEYINFLNKVLPSLADKYLYYAYINEDEYMLRSMPYISSLNGQNIFPLSVNTAEFLECKLQISSSDKGVTIHYMLTLNNKPVKQLPNPNFYPYWIFIRNNVVFLWKNYHHFLLAAYYEFALEKTIQIDHGQWPSVFNYFVKQVQKHIPVEMDATMKIAYKYKKPGAKLKLNESGNFLLIYPIITYGKYEIYINEPGDNFYVIEGKKNVRIKRYKDYEQKIREFVAGLHPSFSENTMQEFFFLHTNELFKNNWFFKFYDKCKEEGIEVYGIRELKNIKYTPSRPSTSFSVKSGIDWFDLNVEIHFEDTKVALKDVRKAVMNNTNYVQIGEGKWGQLPEEWLKQWASLLKFGKVQDNKLKISKLHFQLIELLYQERNDEAITNEIEEKKALLQNFDSVKTVKPPKGLKAKLRNYQQAGLNWLAFLEKFGWGGILADDMGLGKTLQMLAFFKYLQQKKSNTAPVFLVVAPTTLVFNWENEIQKFTPDMKYMVQWGQQRTEDTSSWKEYDLILTTYGTLVRDIGWIKNFPFTVAVLDESQAIKNPSSQRFKAVSLLNAPLRFTLTGTPIENNTMELYAQIQFVNPQFLGSQHFFKEQFAKPIDKNNDEERTRELQKLIKPFLLRRTKERVAKELPPKMEMPLYCEMGKEQRQVYEAFKNEYRNSLLNQIEQEGLDKARFNVLDALLKLRQICDSPGILNTEESYGNESVKIQELLRNIREKTGKHKVLVFSQFVKMLHLVAAELDREGVVYSYLDGSTKDRKKAVQLFQENNEYRVMLISLKAGGQGLNLTEADYIYLIDPWWNPAVEQQAIDRTHRIGQDKHIFAYKMICKDTVEEKILNLQNKKNSLARDIISAEESFVKKLTVEDIKSILE